MKFETSFSWETAFLFNHNQPMPFIVAMLIVIAFVLAVGRTAAWLHEQWVMRKMTRERMRERSRHPKAR